MKLKRLVLGIAAGLIAAPTMLAQSELGITVKFAGDAWQKGLYVTNSNEYGTNSGMEYDVYYQPTAGTFTYNFTLPYNEATNTPGLTFGVLKGYTIDVTCDTSGLTNGDIDTGDYFLQDLSGGGIYAPGARKVTGMNRWEGESAPEVVNGYFLDLYTAKCDGAVFTVTVNEQTYEASTGINLEFKGFDFNAAETPISVSVRHTGMADTYEGKQLEKGLFIEYGPEPQTIAFIITESGPEKLSFVFTPELEPGDKETYTMTSKPGLLGGMTYTYTFWEGAKGHTLTVYAGDVPEPSVSDAKGVATPAPATYTQIDGVSVSWNGTLGQGPNWEEGLGLELSFGSFDMEPAFTILDAEGEETENDGTTLNIYGWWVNSYDPETDESLGYTLDITIPEGLLLVDGLPNAEMTLTYNVVPLYTDYKYTPSRGAMITSIEKIEMEWDGTEGYVLGINPDCKETVTYGPENTPVKSVTDADGTIVIELSEPYTTEGMVSFAIPPYLLTATKGETTVLLGDEGVGFNIAVYTLYPAPGLYYGTLESIVVASVNGTTELAGSPGDITVTDGSTGAVYTKVSEVSAEELMSDMGETFQGLRLTFEKPFDLPNGTAIVTIPAGTLEFDGETYDKAIKLEYYVHPDLPEPAVSPENGSQLEKLVKIEISWNDSPLTLCDGYDPEFDGEFTLTIVTADEEEVIDLGEMVSIVNENGEAEIEGGGTVRSSKLMIDLGEGYAEDGTYKIHVPSGYVLVTDYDNASNGELELVYTIKTNSLGTVGIEESDDVYYDLQGRRVLNPGSGIFIVNGKKVVKSLGR